MDADDGESEPTETSEATGDDDEASGDQQATAEGSTQTDPEPPE